MTQEEYMELNRRYGGQLDIKQIISLFEKSKPKIRKSPLHNTCGAELFSKKVLRKQGPYSK
jgi:hypothetical protein